MFSAKKKGLFYSFLSSLMFRMDQFPGYKQGEDTRQQKRTLYHACTVFLHHPGHYVRHEVS